MENFPLKILGVDIGTAYDVYCDTYTWQATGITPNARFANSFGDANSIQIDWIEGVYELFTEDGKSKGGGSLISFLNLEHKNESAKSFRTSSQG